MYGFEDSGPDWVSGSGAALPSIAETDGEKPGSELGLAIGTAVGADGTLREMAKQT